MLERQGPLPILIFSTIMLYIGYLIAALGAWQQQMWLIFVGYGMFAGIGLGCGYITPVSPLQKWFPDYKGMQCCARKRVERSVACLRVVGHNALFPSFLPTAPLVRIGLVSSCS